MKRKNKSKSKTNPDLWRQVNIVLTAAREAGHNIAADWILEQWEKNFV